MKRLTYLFALALCSLTGCEPDDICLAETPGTPQLVVVFYDALQPEIKKEASNLQVKGFGFETEIHKGTTDSIVIPLRTIENETAFVFTKTENDIAFEEEITFKYETYDRFTSRACGYQKNFTNIRSERLNSIVWINDIEIIKDSISDTKNAHIKILH